MKEFILTLIVGCLLLIAVWCLKCTFERKTWIKRIQRDYPNLKCKYWMGEDSYVGNITNYDDENYEVEITTFEHGVIKRNINDINPY